MSERTVLQKLGDDARPLYERFWEIIGPYQNELWGYCRKLAGNPWDGEDLYQDTLLKMFTSLSSLSHREQPIHPRAFLFRVATNHWIDINRKRRMPTEEWTDGPASDSDSLSDVDMSLEVREAFETLLASLPPRQAVILVLMDSLQFTAREAAEILGTTEGAIHAALFRARESLRKLAANGTARVEPHYLSSPRPDPSLVDRYVSCFNRRDFQGIANLLAENAVYSFVAQASKEYGKGVIMQASHNPSHYERADLQAFVMELWGRQAVIFCRTTQEGTPEALNEIMAAETEDGHIISLNGYYFCPQFMEAAAAQLGLPREEESC
ncbi:RNA polymerase sigma factor [Cohnella sp. AR92]|uniref:RNA polymerase sigma factor n=1 Tax=Cohnella sp. AR92 TaxID=648716 RepID=UPI000F8EE143|nr:RNA polymerase sigma factor [Cohnella sp. AR92]RUS48961.1 RNA polymerase sigma factor [Cohnella sp. AR92]